MRNIYFLYAFVLLVSDDTSNFKQSDTKNDSDGNQLPLLCIVPGCNNVKSLTDKLYFSLPNEQEG